jgi:hypothetical protein
MSPGAGCMHASGHGEGPAPGRAWARAGAGPETVGAGMLAAGPAAAQAQGHNTL